MKLLSFFIVILLIYSCSSLNTPYYSGAPEEFKQADSFPESKPVYTLYLAGDAGELDDKEAQKNYVLEALKKEFKGKGDDYAVVYLGDNLYPAGLVPPWHTDRERGEAVLAAQVEVVDSSDATAYFVPGNHDWNHFRPGGLYYIQSQERFVESHPFGKAELFPNNGCGEPGVKEINEDLVLIFVDSQWWLQDWGGEIDMNKGCRIKTRRQFLDEMDHLFYKYDDRQIVVMMHHPSYSVGNHGGYYPLADHLFPLRALNEKLYIPLPVIGSIYPTYRSVTGHMQDLPHPEYQRFHSELINYATRANDVIFAAGHEHSLQYFHLQDMHFVISGSASRNSFIKRGENVLFAYGQRGFGKLEFFDDGQVWLSFYTKKSFEDSLQQEFIKRIVKAKPETEIVPVDYPWGDLLPDTFTVAANSDISSGSFVSFWMGKQYRDIWTTPILSQVLNLADTLGGLEPVQKVSGSESSILRVENGEGKSFRLKSMYKDYSRIFPERFKNEKAISLLKHKISAMHPYAPLLASALAEHAEILHTKPVIRYLALQEKLGNYSQLIEQGLFFLEEIPNGDWSSYDHLGNSKNIVSSAEMTENILLPDHDVDQASVLYTRLFDMWIHDWDRNESKYRWASFRENGKTIYRPISFDRDMAFYSFSGFLPKILAIYGIRRLKPIESQISDIVGLNYTSRHFDRYFLNELEWEEWKSTVEKFQQTITDEGIDRSFSALPTEVRDMQRERIASTLKLRKNRMLQYAREYYELINKEIDISGTDTTDIFIIERTRSGDINLTINSISLEGDIPKYHRVIDANITEEIRLYGLGGEDKFIFRGDENNDITVRIIGGEDDDILIDETNGSLSRNVFVYDVFEGIEIQNDYKYIDRRSDKDQEVNDFDRDYFRYNKQRPRLNFGYNIDDRIWLGAGLEYTTYAWRQDPFASQHRIMANFTPGIKRTFNVTYEGEFINRLWDDYEFYPTLQFSNPHYINFFGLGMNSEIQSEETEYHWLKLSHYKVELLPGQILSGNAFMKFGPVFEAYQYDYQANRIIESLFAEDSEKLDRNYYGGFKVNYGFEAVNDWVEPTEGIQFHGGLSYMANLKESENTLRFDADLAFYLALTASPRIIFATKVAYSTIYGEPELFQYPAIGHYNGLRSYRVQRFRGNSSFYHMTDLRMKIFDWRNNFLPMDIGLVGGFDYARVWVKDDNRKGHHTGFTVGMSFNILNKALIHPFYSFGGETDQFALRLGYSF